MTLPDERKNALLTAREFLVEIITARGKMTHVQLKSRAANALKHYPTPSEIDALSDAAPELLSGKMKWVVNALKAD